MREFIWPVRVYYEDTDHGGVVYHANFLKFMERARTEWLRTLGIEQDQMREEEGVEFVVRSVALDYRKPALFNDELEVSATVSRFGPASIDFLQQVRRQGELLCEGEVRIASLDSSSRRPKAVSDRLLQRMKEIEE